MLKVTLFICLLGTAIAGGESFAEKYAFRKVMTNCFGTERYYGYAKDLNRIIYECKTEINEGQHNNVQINEAPLASFVENLRSSSTAQVQYVPPVYVHSSKAANPYGHYHRQKREAIFSNEMLKKMVAKVKAKSELFMCVLRKRNSIDENNNLKFADIKANILQYTAGLDPILSEGMNNVIQKCSEAQKCVYDKDSPLPIEVQRIEAFFKCDKMGRLNLCTKYDMTRYIQDFDLSGLPEFEGGDENAKVEKLLQVFRGAEPGVENLDLLA